jgi:arginase
MTTEHRPITVLGVPLDLGVSKLGVDMGPTAIRYAGIFEALAFAGLDYVDAGDLEVVRNFALDHLPPAGAGKRPSWRDHPGGRGPGRAVATPDGAGSCPSCWGGPRHGHRLHRRRGRLLERLGVLWIDAHPDANTPATSPSGNIHGMPLAVSLGHGIPELVNCAGFAPKVRPEDVCIVGARDIDPGEAAFLRRLGIRHFTTYDIQNMGLHPVMDQALETVSRRTDAVYVSFDTDVIEGGVAPGTGIVTRGGLSYREISFLMQYIGQTWSSRPWT